MNCKLCDRPAWMHVASAVTGERESYCFEHAVEAGFVTPQNAARMEAEGLKAASVRIRRVVGLIREHGRMPNAAELEQLGGRGDMSSTEPGSARFAEQVRFLETLADFIDAHGRFPREDEMPPDPFLPEA